MHSIYVARRFWVCWGVYCKVAVDSGQLLDDVERVNVAEACDN
jgi:hypothetical protein